MSTFSPHSPRKQRRMLYEADTTRRRRLMSVPLSKELRGRFHRRALPLRKGDTVRILKGSYVGREERVAKVDRRGLSVTLDNVTSKTGESKSTPLPVRTGSLILVRLNLADPWRRRLLRVTEAEVTPEERGETPTPAVETPVGTEPVALPPETPAVESAEKDDTLEGLLDDEDSADDPDEEDDTPADEKGDNAPAPKRTPRPRSSSPPTPKGGHA
ncbi:MAG: 50S ribosomal protein L24 [Thermoplasmata archaeon]